VEISSRRLKSDSCQTPQQRSDRLVPDSRHKQTPPDRTIHETIILFVLILIRGILLRSVNTVSYNRLHNLVIILFTSCTNTHYMFRLVFCPSSGGVIAQVLLNCERTMFDWILKLLKFNWKFNLKNSKIGLNYFMKLSNNSRIKTEPRKS
jgi:hypothetical protein